MNHSKVRKNNYPTKSVHSNATERSISNISSVDKETLYNTFADLVQKRLSDKIVGDVTCVVIHSYLCATIAPNNFIKWHYKCSNFDERVLLGMTSKEFAEDIAYQYKRFILDYFFK